MTQLHPCFRAAAMGILLLNLNFQSPLAGGAPSAFAQKPQDSVNRYLESLRLDLSRQIQFAAHRNNDARLWAEVRHVLNNALYLEWRSGRLLGDKPEQAYYVHCDRTTMTQNDLDNGRLIVLVGVAPVRPAEFAIIRITQNATPAKNRVPGR